MLLDDVFSQLTFGELSQLYVSGRDEIGIQPCDYEKIIPHINMGLTELHKRFDIKKNTVIVDQSFGLEKYPLHSKFAVSNVSSPEPNKYILDTAGLPFQDDILHIERIKDSFGNDLTINNPNNFIDVSPNGQFDYSFESDQNNIPYPRTVYLPSYLTIQSTYSNQDILTVGYRANHPKIATVGLDLSTQEVDLPYGLYEPLLNYIAARVYTSMSEQDGGQYMQKFEMGCKKIEELGLENIVRPSNIKLDERGFV